MEKCQKANHKKLAKSMYKDNTFRQSIISGEIYGSLFIHTWKKSFEKTCTEDQNTSQRGPNISMFLNWGTN